MGGDKKKILVVDDHDIIRRAVRRALERAGYEVVEAANGAEALEQARVEEDLYGVLCDTSLGEKERGNKVAQELLGINPNYKIVGMSIYQENEEVWTGEGHRFILKPKIRDYDLVSVIEGN